MSDISWELLQAMTGQGTISIREVARRVSQNLKAVHGDVQALLNAGAIDSTGEGNLFLFDAVRVDFMLTKAT